MYFLGECSNNILINNDKKKNISFDPNNPPYKICNGGYPQQVLYYKNFKIF